MSPKQERIFKWLVAYENIHGVNTLISLDTAVELIGGDIFTNARKHVGALLANMVKRGILTRGVRRGTFKLAKKAPPKWPDWMTTP